MFVKNIYQKHFEGDSFVAEVDGIIVFYALADGLITELLIKLDEPNIDGDATFSVTLNGTGIGDIIILANVTSGQLTGLEIAVELFDRIILNLTDLTGGTIQTPIAFQLGIVEDVTIDLSETLSFYQLEEHKGQEGGYAPLDENAKLPEIHMPYDISTVLSFYQLEEHKGQAGGYAPLDEDSLLPVEHLPNHGHAQYELTAEKAQPNGYAPLDNEGLLPVEHLPTHTHDYVEPATLADYQLLSEKGEAQGYAPLNEGSVIPEEYLDLSGILSFYELDANKGQEGGYAPLDENGDLPLVHLPDHTHEGYQEATEKGAASGYASLDGDGHLEQAGLEAFIFPFTDLVSEIENDVQLAKFFMPYDFLIPTATHLQAFVVTTEGTSFNPLEIQVKHNNTNILTSPIIIQSGDMYDDETQGFDGPVLVSKRDIITVEVDAGTGVEWRGLSLIITGYRIP